MTDVIAVSLKAMLATYCPVHIQEWYDMPCLDDSKLLLNVAFNIFRKTHLSGQVTFDPQDIESKAYRLNTWKLDRRKPPAGVNKLSFQEIIDVIYEECPKMSVSGSLDDANVYELYDWMRRYLLLKDVNHYELDKIVSIPKLPHYSLSDTIDIIEQVVQPELRNINYVYAVVKSKLELRSAHLQQQIKHEQNSVDRIQSILFEGDKIQHDVSTDTDYFRRMGEYAEIARKMK